MGYRKLALLNMENYNVDGSYIKSIETGEF